MCGTAYFTAYRPAFGRVPYNEVLIPMFRSIILVAVCSCALWAQSSVLEQARTAYQRTDYETAFQLLSTIEERTPEVHALLGKVQYGQADFKGASDSFERAVDAEPENADYRNWLGKAFGRRAENSSFLTAPMYARRCRSEFERAVELDPKNLDAAGNLFDYYLEAPSLLGGGMNKAAGLAVKIRTLSEAQYHYSQAQMARKRKDWEEAEEHLRTAVEIEPNDPGRLADLASFLASQERYEESDRVFEKAMALRPEAPSVLYEKAVALAEADRNLDEAQQLLEQYLKAELTPDDPPRYEAGRLLSRIRK